jgi:hypothetical protein
LDLSHVVNIDNFLLNVIIKKAATREAVMADIVKMIARRSEDEIRRIAERWNYLPPEDRAVVIPVGFRPSVVRDAPESLTVVVNPPGSGNIRANGQTAPYRFADEIRGSRSGNYQEVATFDPIILDEDN